VKSGLRRFRNQGGKPPIPLGDGRRYSRGLSFNLGAGTQDRQTYLRQYGISGTLFGIVSLLAESSATPTWRLYKKQPVDGRRRYSTSDQGSDQRIEVVQHAAIQLVNNPNDWHSGFEFREGSQQHEELTGETFWVLDTEAGFPTSMWYVRPDRMEPVPDPDDFLVGWIYTSATGEQVPLRANEVILEKRPDPLDPYRGAGPVASIMPNIQQQRYATEYQRNLFLNGADPGGIITVPHALGDREFDELIDRWRESHRGVARAGHVGVLEDGMTWAPSSHTNKDLEYGQLRLANRDELREAWRIHKAMMGTSDDVNRANAQTAQEVFVAWQILPRLNRRRDTLNSKLLPLFGQSGAGVEFDYDDPSPVNAETAATELLQKSQALGALITAGVDLHDALEAVGLPDMAAAEPPPAPPAPPAAPGLPGAPQLPALPPAPGDRERIAITAGRDAAAKAFEQTAADFPAAAVAWMHHATWSGPMNVPLSHIDPKMPWMDDADPDHVQEFVEDLQDGKKLKPVLLVKTPSGGKLELVEGHHRWLAAAELKQPIRSYVATVQADHGPWETMHSQQYGRGGNGKAPKALADPPQWIVQTTEDRSTCQPCLDNADTVYDTQEEAYADYPDGGHYTQCLGADNCRCQIVKTSGANARAARRVLGAAQAALVRRILSDGYMPIELAGRP
jgi:HK97 family phage portal protein